MNPWRTPTSKKGFWSNLSLFGSIISKSVEPSTGTGLICFQTALPVKKLKNRQWAKACHRKSLLRLTPLPPEGLQFRFLLSDLVQTVVAQVFPTVEEEILVGLFWFLSSGIRQSAQLRLKMGWPPGWSEVKLAVSGSTAPRSYAEGVVSLAWAESQTKERKERGEKNSSFNSSWVWPTVQRHKQHISSARLCVDMERNWSHTPWGSISAFHHQNQSVCHAAPSMLQIMFVFLLCGCSIDIWSVCAY